MTRYDGLVVRRRNLLRFDPGAAQPSDAFFGTFAARGDLLLAYSITYHSPGPVSTQLLPLCSSNPSMPGCEKIVADLKQWGRAAIAVHASTLSRANLRINRASRGDGDGKTS